MLCAIYKTRDTYDKEAKQLKVYYRTGCMVNRVPMIRICSTKSLDYPLSAGEIADYTSPNENIISAWDVSIGC